MRNFPCTTQVPNSLFDELLSELSFAELKVLLAVNRATWGWVAGKDGHRRERAWLACSRMQAVTGLSKRAITNAVAALVRRRLLCVSDEQGNALEHPEERRGQTKLFYSLGYPQVDHRQRRRSASNAEVDQHRMPIIETNQLENQRTMSRSGRTTKAGYTAHIASVLKNAVSSALWERIRALENRTVQNPQSEGSSDVICYAHDAR